MRVGHVFAEKRIFYNFIRLFLGGADCGGPRGRTIETCELLGSAYCLFNGSYSVAEFMGHSNLSDMAPTVLICDVCDEVDGSPALVHDVR